MTKNKGFTYYELLIVITIMSLMVGFMTIGIGTISRNNVNRVADDIETSVKAARNYALTKGTENGWANFYYNDKTLYCYIGKEITPSNPVDFTTQNWQKIGNSFDSVSFNTVTLVNGSVASLNFKQSTGEFNGIDWPLGAAPGLHHNAVDIRIFKGDSSKTVSIDLFGTINIH